MAVNALLRLSARGEALVAELLRISDHIPPVFSLAEKAEQKMYGEVLLDFCYLKTPALFEHKIESSMDLVERDGDVWDEHGPIICRVYKLFESIYKYLKDFVKYASDLSEGVYLQQTVEGVLLDDEGKQLMCEVLYLYGVLLLLMDAKLDGAVRERIVIAYYRHKGQSAVESIEDMELLVRKTGYSPNVLERNGLPRRPPGYPEEYLCRLPRKHALPQSIVLMMIDRLRSEDMYAQIPSYPMPQHRSTALATQARMLYVILYFTPDVLHEQQHTMREIVDRHFAGADAYWVVPYYMGFLEELPHAWEGYKAAKAALSNTTNAGEIKRLYAAHTASLEANRQQLGHYLTEGVLTEEYCLEHTAELLSCVRSCNVTLRWLVLHRRARLRRLPVSDADYEAREGEQLLLLLMDTAQYEYTLRGLFSSLLGKKDEMWEASRTAVVERLRELSEAFTGTRALSRIGKDEQLQAWFSSLADQVTALDSADSNASGRKMHHLIAALTEVEQFHQIEGALQLQQYLGETRDLLSRMIRVVNVRESTLVTLSVVSDLSYAWLAIADYAPLMRSRIQRNPFSVLKLRATFLKLVSILDGPLVRINQAQSPDFDSVSQYYSSEVAAFMQRILQVIPENMFAVLSEVIQINAAELAELPVKVERASLREWAQLEPRHRLARATHRIAVLTEGVLCMQTTLLGVVKVDPKELLTDGIRRELVAQLSSALHSGLSFKQGKVGELEVALSKLSAHLQGFQLALEYIADYVKINGLQLWQEQLSSVLNFYVEQERNQFLRKKVHSWQSPYTLAAEAANHAPPKAFEHSFFGRLLRETLYLSAPRRTIYSEGTGGWVDLSGKEVVGTRLLRLLQRALTQCGMRGLCSTLGFLVASLLHRYVVRHQQSTTADTLAALDALDASLSPSSTLPDKAAKLYSSTAAAMPKLLAEVSETVARVGTAQLLRAHMNARVLGETQIECSLLYAILANADAALLTEFRAGRADGEPTGSDPAARTATSSGLPSDELAPGLCGPGTEAASDMRHYLDASGLACPKEHVLVVARPLARLSLVLAVFTVTHLSKMAWSPSLAALTAAKLTDEAIDGVPLVWGIGTLLRQQHADVTTSYVEHLEQYVRAQLHAAFSTSSSRAPSDPPADVVTILHFLDLFSRHLGIHVPNLELYITAAGGVHC